MNNDALRQQHDKLLTELYKEETLLKNILSQKTCSDAGEEAAKKIKELEDALNKLRIEMYYL
ncbi:hypothetical protein BH10BAC2_BH10BAC2_11070 [soil metagenome]